MTTQKRRPQNVAAEIGAFWMFNDEYIAKRMRRFESLFPPGHRVPFVIAGAQKAGTTVLKDYLDSHPGLCFGRRKEIHFFDTPELFQSGQSDLRPYHAYFRPEDGQQLLGDATPEYMYADGSVDRLQAYNPAMKVIAILRNPVTRAYSHWNMMAGNGREPLSFRDAVVWELENAPGPSTTRRGRSYLNRGFYTRQIRKLMEHFPSEQLLILRQEDLNRDHNAVLRQIYGFLGVDPLPPVERMESMVGSYSAQMSEVDRAFVTSVFRDEIKDLEDLLGWDCSAWLK